jgi:hypothetical protein
VRDRLQERVLHVVQCPQLLCRIPFAPEGLRVLLLAALERLLRPLALGDVDDHPSELAFPTRVGADVDGVAEPQRLHFIAERPVLEAHVVAGCGEADPKRGDRRGAVSLMDVLAPRARSHARVVGTA